MLRAWFVALLFAACLGAETMPPEGEQRLARDIYKQLVEIPSSYRLNHSRRRGCRRAIEGGRVSRIRCCRPHAPSLP